MFAPWYFSNWDDAFVFLTSTPGQYIDICEICGGKGGVSKIAIRRRLKTGQNFDICVTNMVLLRPLRQSG